MKRIIILLFAVLLSAAPLKQGTKALSASDAQVYTNLGQTDEMSATKLKVTDEFKEKIKLNISPKYSKKEVYVGEVFYVDVVIKSNSKVNFTPKLEFKHTIDMLQLTKKIDFDIKDGVYSTRVYFQANTTNAKISEANAYLYRNTQQIGKSRVVFKELKINPFEANKDYSNLMASNLEVTNVRCSPYDDSSNICGIDVKANNVNFNNFVFKKALSQSISNLSKSFDNASCSIAIILPNNAKSFSFTYYDLEQKKFIEVKKNIIVQIEEVSTQIDLNPVSKEINFIFQITCLVIAVVLLIIVLIFRRFFSLLALALVFIVLGIYEPDKSYEKTLLKNAEIKVLPTKNSSLLFKNPEEKIVKVIANESGYSKIVLGENQSGWVKNEDLK